MDTDTSTAEYEARFNWTTGIYDAMTQAREAWARGEITLAEMKARVAAIPDQPGK